MKEFVKDFIDANSVSSPTGVGGILFVSDVQRLCEKLIEGVSDTDSSLGKENEELKKQVDGLKNDLKEVARPRVKRFI